MKVYMCVCLFMRVYRCVSFMCVDRRVSFMRVYICVSVMCVYICVSVMRVYICVSVMCVFICVHSCVCICVFHSFMRVYICVHSCVCLFVCWLFIICCWCCGGFTKRRLLYKSKCVVICVEMNICETATASTTNYEQPTHK